MAKFDIKRALFFSLVLMLLLGVFLSGFAMGKAQAAKAESIRVYIRGGEWEVFDLTDSSTVFPDGMSYDRVNKRLILDGYNSGPIQSISSKPDDLDIFVKSNSSISLGRSSCINCFIVSKDLLFFKNVNISGNPGTELNLTTKWFKALSNNVHVSDITLKINVNNIYSGKACGADHLTLKNDAKLISNVYGSETSTKSACGIGNLTMMDTSEAKIFVKCKSPYDRIVNGVDNLYLRGTGKLDIDLSGGAYQQAIKFMPSIPEGYITISGDWDHPKVVYVYFDSSSPTPTPTPSPSPTPHLPRLQLLLQPQLLPRLQPPLQLQFLQVLLTL
ncbi:MAG: hypothetical protein GX362_04530 [Methanosarcinaceae archaeon]|nr:hypothetical protein [Methanosarcinaceae archaeon]